MDVPGSKLQDDESMNSPPNNQNRKNATLISSDRSPTPVASRESPNQYPNLSGSNLDKSNNSSYTSTALSSPSNPLAKKEEKLDIPWKVVIVCCILALGFGLAYSSSNSVDSQKTEDRRECSEFLSLNGEFPRQDKRLFKFLQLGVEGIFNNDPTKPSIFAMISKDTRSMNKIMEKVIKSTQSCFRSNSIINLSPKDLSSEHYKNDSSMIIAEYRELLESAGIMLVNDFNQLPFEVVPIFHSICDVENPLVKKSVIFLTMYIPELPRHVDNPIEYLHRFLEDLWQGKIRDNILQPLITRITDQVFILHPEF